MPRPFSYGFSFRLVWISVVLGGILAAASPAVAQTAWTGDGDGLSWADPANWSTGEVPDASSDVVIDLAGSIFYTVRLSTEREVASLQLDSEVARLELVEALTVAGRTSWTYGTIRGPSTLVAAGGIDIGAGSEGRRILGDAEVRIPAGATGRLREAADIDGSPAGVLTVDDGATLEIETGAQLIYDVDATPTSLLQNFGILRLQNTAATSQVQWDLVNAGLIETQATDASGELRFTGAITDQDGTYRSSTGVLAFEPPSDAEYTFGSGSSIEGGGTVDVRSGTASILGTLDVTGTLRVAGSRSVGGPDVTVGAGATVALGALLDLDRGTLQVEGTAPLTVDSLAINANSSLGLTSDLTVRGGMLMENETSVFRSNNTLEVGGLMEWRGGLLEGTGTTRLAGGVLFDEPTFSSSNRRGIDQQRVVIAANTTAIYADTPLEGGDGAELVIEPGAVLEFTRNGFILPRSDVTSVPRLINQGTIRKTQGAGLDDVEISFEIVNEGLMEIEVGELVLFDLPADVDGTFRAAASGRIRFEGAGDPYAFSSTSSLEGDGDFEFRSASPVSIGGTYDISGRALAFTGASLTFEPGASIAQPSGTLDLNGATARIETTGALAFDELRVRNGATLETASDLTVITSADIVRSDVLVSGDITAQGDLGWSGGTISGAGVLRAEGPSVVSSSSGAPSVLDQRQLVVADGATLSYTGVGNLEGANGAEILIEAGATFEITREGDIRESTGSTSAPRILNQGTLRKSGTGTAEIAIDLINEGTIDLADAFLDIRGSLQNTGRIQGIADLQTGNATSITNTGVVAPGSPGGNPPEFLSINGPFSFDSGSALEIEINGSGSDELVLTGPPALGGTLQVQLLDGFTPSIGDSFILVNAFLGGITGTFETIDVPDLGPGQAFEVAYTSSRVRLNVVESGPPTAETPWPTFGGDIQRTGTSPIAVPNALSETWAFRPGRAFVAQPVLGSDGTIYAPSPTGSFWAVNPDGTERWRVDDITSRATAAVADDGTIYTLGRGSSNLVALDPTGDIRWEVNLGDRSNLSPAVGPDGTIYIAASNGIARAINPDGTEKWSLEIPDAGFVVGGATTTIDGSTVLLGLGFASGGGGRVVAIAAADGTIQWETGIPGDLLAYTPSVASDGSIYVSSAAAVAALEADGTLRWIRDDLGGFGYVSIDPNNGRVYARLNASRATLVAVDGASGDLVWEAPLNNTAVQSPTIAADGRLLVSTFGLDPDRGSLYVLNPDGSVVSQTDFSDRPQTPPILTGSGRVLISATDALLAFDEVGPQLTLSPLTLDFGQVPLGQSAEATLTLENTGGAALEVFGAAIEAGGGAFSVSETFPFTIAPGDDRLLPVTFAPGTAGVVSTELFVDSNSDTDPGSVLLSGDGVSGNAAPTAADDNATTDEGTPVVVDVLANDADPEDDPLTISDVGSPDFGTTDIVAGGVEYTPNAGFSGTDTFPYTVDDGNGNTATAQVTVTVAATTGTIAGTVRESATGTPIPGASVTVQGLAEATTTQTDGTYALAGIPEGTYTVDVSAVGYETATQEVTVTAGETVVADFLLVVPAGVVRWTGEGDGTTWSDGANWSTGTVPTADDDAVIDLDPGSSYTVSVDGAFSVGSLRLEAGRASLSLDNPLGVDGAFSFVDGVITGGSDLSVGGGFPFTGGVMAGTGTIEIEGPLQWTGGRMSGTGQTIANGTAVVRADDGGFFPARDIRERTLVFNGDATLEAGNIGLEAGAVVRIASTSTFTVATDDTGLRALLATSPTPLVDIQGTLVKTGGSGINSVFLGEDGLTRVDVSGIVRAEQGDVQFEPAPESVLSGTFDAGAGTSIVYTEGGTLTGTLQGAGTHTFFDPYVIEAAIDVAGRIILNRTQTVADAATVQQLGELITSTFQPDQLVTFGATGPAPIETLDVRGNLALQTDVEITETLLLGVDAEATVIGTGSLTIAPSAEMQWGTGVLGGSGAVQVDGTLTAVVAQYLDGDFTVQASDKTLSGRELVVAGSATWDDATLTLDDGARLRVAEGGVFDIQRDASFELGTSTTGSESVEVAGTLRKTGVGARTSTGSAPVAYDDTDTGTPVAMPLENGGTVSIEAGALAPITLTHTGVLQGGGTLDLSDADATFSNQGSVAPGVGPGRLTVLGDYNNAEAILAVELGGTTVASGYDQLEVSGPATLGGAIDLSVIEPFDPPSGSSYVVLTAASVSGTFDVVTTPDLAGRAVEVVVEDTEVTVNVTATSANAPPVAADDEASTTAGEAVAIDVLANDSDPDDDALSITEVTDPENGTAEIQDASVTYTPDASFVGTDSFSYTVSDGQGGTDEALVTVDVTEAPNQPPVAQDDAAATVGGQTVQIDVLANDSDPDDDPLSIESVGPPDGGTAEIQNGQVAYTPASSFTGTDVFPYTVSDGRGGTDIGTISVTVEAANRPPVAVDDAVLTVRNTPVRIPVLANDSDPDGDPLIIASFSQPDRGSVTRDGDALVFTPATDATGVETFAYVIDDGRGGTAEATVEVTVSGLAFTVENLGTLGGAASRATAINDDGTVVGVSISTDGTAQGFTWSDGQIQPLRVGSTPFIAFDVNRTGDVAGYTITNRLTEAALVRANGQTVSLGTLGGDYSAAFGVSDAGVVVGTGQTPGGPVRAFQWDGQIASLGAFGAESSEAFGVSPGGIPVGAATQPDGRSVAFIGTALVAGSASSRAYAADDRGAAVGSVLDGTAVRPVRWRPDRSALSLLAPGSPFAEAYDISAIGWVVGTTATGTPQAASLHDPKAGEAAPSASVPPALVRQWSLATDFSLRRLTAAPAARKALSADLRATLWLDDAALDLNDFIPPGSGWTLLEARGVNAVGQIVGTGRINGEERAFRLTPIGDDVPTAASDAMTAEPGADVTLRVLDNDADASGGALQLVGWSSPKLGTLRPTADSTALVYRARPDARGTDTFDYTVSNGYGSTATATVELTVERSIDEDAPLELLGSAPNPAAQQASITVLLPRPAYVRLTVYDVLGRRVARLVDGEHPAGELIVPVHVGSWSPGSYFYRLEAEGEALVGRMQVVR